MSETPRSLPAKTRRKQLIKATIKCIAKNGLSGTTMADVTKLAGLSLGIVNLHFETKEIETIECEEALFFFGLNKQLGPIHDWGVALENNKILVNTENFETDKSGIFCLLYTSDAADE